MAQRHLRRNHSPEVSAFQKIVNNNNFDSEEDKIEEFMAKFDFSGIKSEAIENFTDKKPKEKKCRRNATIDNKKRNCTIERRTQKLPNFSKTPQFSGQEDHSIELINESDSQNIVDCISLSNVASDNVFERKAEKEGWCPALRRLSALPQLKFQLSEHLNLDIEEEKAVCFNNSSRKLSFVKENFENFNNFDNFTEIFPDLFGKMDQGEDKKPGLTFDEEIKVILRLYISTTIPCLSIEFNLCRYLGDSSSSS